MKRRRQLDGLEAEAGLVKALDDGGAALGLHDIDHPFDDEPDVRQFRRRGLATAEQTVGTLTLIKQDGVYFWRDSTLFANGGGRRRSRRGPSVDAGDIVTQRRFALLPADKINASLQALDDKLSPKRGLRQFRGGVFLDKPPKGPFKGKTLLLIHGTFSNNDNLVDELKATAHGAELLARAEKAYAQVLAFDHDTVAVSPSLNALDLSRLLAGSAHDVHIIAHSRGGLVARWWLEVYGGGAGRNPKAVLAGSPIAGTSLASGPGLRGAMDLLTNVSAALATTLALGAAANPFFLAPAAILRVVASLTRGLADLPIADAAVAMIPGLFAQSRISNNSELKRLMAGAPALAPEYFIITSDFEPAGAGWAFWKYFNKTRVANALADLVFDEANDLVVNTGSMNGGPDGGLNVVKTCAFSSNGDVRHCNYFRQRRAIDFIREQFKLA